MIIAIDFDDTICKSRTNFPITPVIIKAIQAKNKGHELILWTCRGDDWLDEAVKFCADYGLFFDSINENIKGRDYNKVSCKVVADLYVDDKAPGSIDYFLKMKL